MTEYDPQVSIAWRNFRSFPRTREIQFCVPTYEGGDERTECLIQRGRVLPYAV